GRRRSWSGAVGVLGSLVVSMLSSGRPHRQLVGHAAWEWPDHTAHADMDCIRALRKRLTVPARGDWGCNLPSRWAGVELRSKRGETGVVGLREDVVVMATSRVWG